MYRIIFSTALVLAAIGCDKSSGENKPEEKTETSVAQKSEGPQADTPTPESSSVVEEAKTVVPEPGDVIVGGRRYFVSIFDPGNFAESKSHAQKMDDFVRFLIDTDDTALWERKNSMGSNFSFAAVVAAGDKKYNCSNYGYGSFTEAEARALLSNCRRLAESK